MFSKYVFDLVDYFNTVFENPAYAVFWSFRKMSTMLLMAQVSRGIKMGS